MVFRFRVTQFTQRVAKRRGRGSRQSCSIFSRSIEAGPSRMNNKVLVVVPCVLALSAISYLISKQNGTVILFDLPSTDKNAMYSTASSEEDANTSVHQVTSNIKPSIVHQTIAADAGYYGIQQQVTDRDIAHSGAEYNCSDNLCLQYLSIDERKYQYARCIQRVINKIKSYDAISVNNVGTCHFMNGTGREPVALASFPGSGNTWVRGLLEKATGICTGAIYCDADLRRYGFRGEGIKSGSVLAVKAHIIIGGGDSQKAKKKLTWYNTLGAAILIIRNPKDTLVANWNRWQVKKSISTLTSGSKIPQSSHVASANKTSFGTNKEWSHYLRSSVLRWKDMIKFWADFGKFHPLHVVYYEDLKTNATAEVEKMLTFLRVPYSPAEVVQRLEEDFTGFHRIHVASDDFQHYTPDQETFVRQVVVDILELQRTGMDTKFSHIQRYL